MVERVELFQDGQMTHAMIHVRALPVFYKGDKPLYHNAMAEV